MTTENKIVGATIAFVVLSYLMYAGLLGIAGYVAYHFLQKIW